LFLVELHQLTLSNSIFLWFLQWIFVSIPQADLKKILFRPTGSLPKYLDELMGNMKFLLKPYTNNWSWQLRDFKYGIDNFHFHLIKFIYWHIEPTLYYSVQNLYKSCTLFDIIELLETGIMFTRLKMPVVCQFSLPLMNSFNKKAAIFPM